MSYNVGMGERNDSGEASPSLDGALPGVTIYTDGACIGNPGPGGWAAILTAGEKRKALSGGADQTTSQRMEVTAAIEALAALKRPCSVEIFSDSQYLVQTMMNGCNRRANLDLWEVLDRQAARHQVRFIHVRGHRGIPLNEEADRLANREAQARARRQEKPR